MTEQTVAGSGEPERIIAIAVDASDNARSAYKYYLKHIKRVGDKVCLLHCVEINSILHSSNWYSSPLTFNEQMLPTLLKEEEERTKRKLDAFASWLKQDGVSGIVKSIHAESPGPGIVKTAEDISASMIVIGTRGMGKIRRTIMGSVSDYVIHHSHVPVLVCRHESDIGRQERK